MNAQISPSASQANSAPREPARRNSRKTIIGLSACMALQMTSFVMIMPLFARRFSEIGAGVEDLAHSDTAFALTAALAAPFMGSLADRFGRKPLVLISMAVYAVAFIGYLVAQSAAAFIVIRGLAGAFTAGLIPAVTGLAADLAPRERQAQWIGFMSAGLSIGWIAGPIAGGMIYDQWGYSAALVVAIVIALLTFLLALLVIPGGRLSPVPSSARLERKASGSRPKNIRLLLGDLRSTLPSSLPSFMVLMLIVFAVLFAWAFIAPRLVFYTYDDLGWSSSMLGLMMSTFGIAMVVGVLAFGRSSDRLGRKPVILVGLALFSAQFLGLAFFRNYLLLAAAFLIAGLGNALFDPALSAAILDISPLENRSRILGIKATVGSFGSILGPALLARLNSSLDARSVFLSSAGIILLACLAGLFFPGRTSHRKGESGPDATPVKQPAVS